MSGVRLNGAVLRYWLVDCCDCGVCFDDNGVERFDAGVCLNGNEEMGVVMEFVGVVLCCTVLEVLLVGVLGTEDDAFILGLNIGCLKGVLPPVILFASLWLSSISLLKSVTLSHIRRLFV